MTRMTRRINFNAGPAALPVAVLEQAQAEMLDFAGTGASMLEHSHRGPEYNGVHEEVLTLFSELMALPDSHAVVMTQGGGSLQFAMVPMNFLPPGGSADYLVTGYWARLAFEEARRIATVRAAYRLGGGWDPGPPPADREGALARPEGRLCPPHVQQHAVRDAVAGLARHRERAAGRGHELRHPVASRRRFALQAHLRGRPEEPRAGGPRVHRVDKDWLAKARRDLPDILRYEVHLKAKSIYHTPPTFLVYLVGLQLKWIKAHGGAAGMEKRNRTKAERLYGTLDRLAGFYRAPVEKASRLPDERRLPSDGLRARRRRSSPKRPSAGSSASRATATSAACASRSTTRCRPRTWTCSCPSWKTSPAPRASRASSRSPCASLDHRSCRRCAETGTAVFSSGANVWTRNSSTSQPNSSSSATEVAPWPQLVALLLVALPERRDLRGLLLILLRIVGQPLQPHLDRLEIARDVAEPAGAA